MKYVKIIALDAESSAPVGSSANSTSQSVRIVRAIATFCCSPPDKVATGPSICPAKFILVSNCLISARCGCWWLKRCCKTTFSKTGKDWIKLYCWKIKPIVCLRKAASWLDFNWYGLIPAIATVPPVGRVIPEIQYNNVLLPDPEGPTILTNSPFYTVNEIFFNKVVVWSDCPIDTTCVSWSTESIVFVILKTSPNKSCSRFLFNVPLSSGEETRLKTQKNARLK